MKCILEEFTTVSLLSRLKIVLNVILGFLLVILNWNIFSSRNDKEEMSHYYHLFHNIPS